MHPSVPARWKHAVSNALSKSDGKWDWSRLSSFQNASIAILSKMHFSCVRHI